jgi:hypothetical protein
MYLMFSVRAVRDVVFREELAYLQARFLNLHVRIFVSQDPDTAWDGPRGQITRDAIADFVPDFRQGPVMLCGPAPMMTAMRQTLVAMGVPDAEVLSLGNSLEIVKDLGDAETVAGGYQLNEFTGTHAIGHVRMATESDVDISGAHPYWAYPFSDVAVVHNGQLTNYHEMKRRFQQRGFTFQTHNDSEVISVYIADKLSRGVKLNDALHESLEDLDGTFTYVVDSNNTVQMRPIDVALTQGATVVIKSGLQPGDRVVTDGQEKLQAGMRVAPQAPAKKSSSSSGNIGSQT